MNLLYHYAANQKGFGILNDKEIRLSDIRKSNDYDEMILFFPDVLDEILRVYTDDPFDFKFDGQNGKVALSKLIESTSYMIYTEIENGGFTNFVVCFSEKPDLLSQWRGYANNGQGICIGFSKELLMNKCAQDKSIFRLEKVIYITEKRRKEIVREVANEAIEELRVLRKWIVENMTFDDSSPDTDSLLGYNFCGLIENFMIASLKYKQIGFKEEKEWRLFLNNKAYKNPEWVVGKEHELFGPNGFSDTISFLRNKIAFNISDDNISPYVPLGFSELGDNIVKAIWIGPRSHISEKYLVLFLAQKGYSDIKLFFSKTSYR